MSSPVGLLLFPFFITDIILAAILDCQKSVIQPANLTDSKLVFEVLGNASNNSLTNHLQIQLLSKPWWQKADWNYSYPFSQKGRWSSAGGDIDTTFTPILSTHTGTTIEFGITTYFKSLISNLNTVHYGLLVSTPDATLDSVQLASVQYVSTTQRPKIVSTYTGSCTKSSSSTTQRVFYLSNPVETSK